jgi:Leucine-rich repeat (LRR) protein
LNLFISLKILNFDKNCIQKIDKNIHFEFHLRELSLKENKIYSFEMIKNLNNLNRLFLSKNYLTKIQMKDIGRCCFIDLSENPLLYIEGELISDVLKLHSTFIFKLNLENVICQRFVLKETLI